MCVQKEKHDFNIHFQPQFFPHHFHYVDYEKKTVEKLKHCKEKVEKAIHQMLGNVSTHKVFFSLFFWKLIIIFIYPASGGEK